MQLNGTPIENQFLFLLCVTNKKQKKLERNLIVCDFLFLFSSNERNVEKEENEKKGSRINLSTEFSRAIRHDRALSYSLLVYRSRIYNYSK